VRRHGRRHELLDLGLEALGDHPKTGQGSTPQNRPTSWRRRTVLPLRLDLAG
jgi:hypothetical protein